MDCIFSEICNYRIIKKVSKTNFKFFFVYAFFNNFLTFISLDIFKKPDREELASAPVLLVWHSKKRETTSSFNFILTFGNNLNLT